VSKVLNGAAHCGTCCSYRKHIAAAPAIAVARSLSSSVARCRVVGRPSGIGRASTYNPGASVVACIATGKIAAREPSIGTAQVLVRH